MSTRSFFRLLAVFVAALLLAGIWLLLPRQTRAQTLLPAPTLPPSGEWLGGEPWDALPLRPPSPFGRGAGGEGEFPLSISSSLGSPPVGLREGARGERTLTDDFLPLVRRIERTTALNRPQGAISLHFDLSSHQVVGRVPAPLPVMITLTRQGAPSWNLTTFPVADAGGYLYAADLSNYGYIGWPVPGDVVSVRQGAQIISLTVPVLDARLSAPRDVLTGTAPADAALSAYLFPFDDPAAWYTATSVAQSSGAYTLTWAAFPDLRPRDRGYLRYALDADRSVYRAFIAPFLRVQAGGLLVDGMALPFQWVGGVGGRWRWGAFADGSGYFSADGSRMYAKAFRPPPLAPGDRVSLSAGGQIVSTTVQTLTAHAAAWGVYGSAPPGERVEVLRFAGPLDAYQSTWDGTPLQRLTATVDSSGIYSLAMPLEAGNYGYVLLDNPDGHQTFDWFALPYTVFRLGWHTGQYTAVSGQVDVSAPLTVSVRAPGGYLKTFYGLDVRGNGTFPERGPYYYERGWAGGQDGELGFALETGDRVTLTQQGQGTVLSAGMPTLTLQLDEMEQYLFGEAPAGARLTLMRYGSENPVSAVVTASLTGTYRLPLSVLGTADFWDTFVVRWEAPGGYAVERSLGVGYDESGSLCPYWGQVDVGGNTVFWHANSRYCNGAMEVALLNADGERKFEASVSAVTGVLPFRDEAGRPIPILGGDTVEFTNHGQIVRWEVPNLSLHLDPAARQVTGTGVPDTPLSVQVYFPAASTSWHTVVTPTASGAFTLSLPLTPTAGTSALASYASPGTNFLARDALPAWEVDLSSSRVTGLLPPLTPYTLTLHPAGVTTTLIKPETGYANDTGDWNVSFPDAFSTGDVLTLSWPSGAYRLEIPTLNARLDARTAEVLGQAPPGASLRVALTDRNMREWPYLPSYAWEETTADAEGRYRVVFPNLAGGEALQGEVSYRENEAGSVSLSFAPPHWEVTLNGSRIAGTVPSLGVEGAFRWERSSDDVFTVTLHPSILNGAFSVYLPQAVQPGDRLTLTDTRGMVLSYTVPQVTAEHDYARQVLVGEAPAGTVVEAVFFDGHGTQDVFRQVEADESGRYGMDTGDLYLSPGQRGYVLVRDRQGNTIRLDFVITGYRTWFPLVAR